MKKILISLFLLFVFTVAVYADLESDKKQILSLFKKYQLSSSNDMFTYTTDIYYVWDYNEKKLQLTLMHSKFKGTNDVFLDLGAYGGNLSPVMASCPISQKRYPVREFINGINNRSYIGKAPNQNSSSQGTVSSQQLSTQSRSQSSSTTVAIPSGTLYELYDWNNSYKNPTIITDCINSIDVRNIKDNDIILITNLTLTQPGNNLIMFQDRHGHQLYEDLYGRSNSVFYFLPRTGHPDWWDVRLSECAKGKWDKYTQSYGKTTPISVYAKVKRDSKDDYLELLGFILPN